PVRRWKGSSNRLPFSLTTFASHDTGLERKLVDRQAQGLTSNFLGHTGEFEHDPSRFDIGDPPLRRTLTGTHAGLGRLLRQRVVGVDVDPHLAAALDVARHGNTCGLDLPVGDVGGLESLDAVLTEGHRRASLGGTSPPGGVLLAAFHSTRARPVTALRYRLRRGRVGSVRSVTGLVGATRSAVLTTSAATATAPTATRATSSRSLRLLGGKLLVGQGALVDPHLDADAADRGVGFV